MIGAASSIVRQFMLIKFQVDEAFDFVSLTDLKMLLDTAGVSDGCLILYGTEEEGQCGDELSKFRTYAEAMECIERASQVFVDVRDAVESSIISRIVVHDDIPVNIIFYKNI